MPKYNIGDKVRLSVSCQAHRADDNIAEVFEYVANSLPCFKTLKEGRTCCGVSCIVELVEAAKAPEKKSEATFKVGDRVKIIQRKPDNTTGVEGDAVGCVGYIGGVNKHPVRPFNVWSRQGERGEYYGWFDADDLELCPETAKHEHPETVQDKFKPGQKVRVKNIGDYTDHRQLGIGAICTVSKYQSDNKGSVHVDWPDEGYTSAFFSDDAPDGQGISYFLELCLENIRTRWQKGDRVRVLEDRANCANVKKGQILTWSGYGNEFNATDNKHGWLFGVNRLGKDIELVEDEPQQVDETCGVKEPGDGLYTLYGREQEVNIINISVPNNIYKESKGKRTMATVTDKIKALKLKLDPDQKALYDAGFVNIDGDLTDDGDDALETVLFELGRAKLVDLAKQLNADAEKEKKAKK